jgi:hypothetical protein
MHWSGFSLLTATEMAIGFVAGRFTDVGEHPTTSNNNT